MKMVKVIFISSALALTSTVFVPCSSAEVQSENYYRSLWYKTEKSYIKEQETKAQEEADRRDVQLYLEMGRNYLVNNDLPAALVCFRDIIDLEAGMSKKQFTPEARKLISEIDNKLKEDITRDLGKILKQDLNRRREGAKRILKAIGPGDSYVPAVSPEKEMAPPVATISAAPKPQPPVVTKPAIKVDQELVKRKEALEAEISSKRVKVDAELEVKRLEFAKKQMEIDSLLYLAKELIKGGDYAAAIKQAEKVFVIDKSNARAQETIDIARKKIEREKHLAQKKEEEARLSAEREKKRLEDLAKADEEKKKREIQAHFDKGLVYLRNNQFLESTGEFKFVLELDPYNSQAKFYLLEIKNRLERAISDLKKPVDLVEVPIKNKLKAEPVSDKPSVPSQSASDPAAPPVKSKLR